MKTHFDILAPTSRWPLCTAAIKGVWSSESLMCTLAPETEVYAIAIFMAGLQSSLYAQMSLWLFVFSLSPPLSRSHCTIPICPLAAATWRGVLPPWSPDQKTFASEQRTLLTCAEISLVSLKSLKTIAISKTYNCARQRRQQYLRNIHYRKIGAVKTLVIV